MKQPLIIIPGLGDHDRLYRPVVFLWKLLGFDVHLFLFHWDNNQIGLRGTQDKLNTLIKSFDRPVSIVGVSAGGTAAVNALASNPKTIAKIVTVSSPLLPMPHLTHALLKDSLGEALQNLQYVKPATRNKILSVHGSIDQVVPVDLSRPGGIRTFRVTGRGHGASIASALILHSLVIRKYLTS